MDPIVVFVQIIRTKINSFPPPHTSFTTVRWGGRGGGEEGRGVDGLKKRVAAGETIHSPTPRPFISHQIDFSSTPAFQKDGRHEKIDSICL
jgi:hypothetical protein